MSTTVRKHGALYGAVLGTGATLALVIGLGVLVGAGEAAQTAAPVNTSQPTISGNPQEGQTLTGNRGTWSGLPSDYNVNWTRCDKIGSSCADISGSGSDTYTLTSADVGNTVRFNVGAQNADGRTFASSVPTAVITATAAAPVNTSPPTINGTPQAGQKLTGNRGTWSNSPNDYNDNWTRCDRNGNSCADITGSGGDTYTLTAADVGNTVRFKVGAANGGGRTFASSVPTAVITATAAAPVNTSPPTISGTPQAGQRLTGNRGAWSNSPNDYNDNWTRCDRNGNSCADISGSGGDTYTLTAADVGNTVRFKVGAANGGGRTFASSNATAVITAVTPAPAAGCPAGTGTIQIANLGPPARLLIDGQQTSPSVVSRRTRQLIVRYHVSACGGRAVQGALVYATAVPFNQLSVPAEQTTGADGWATTSFTMLAGFPVSSKQGLIAIFTRVRKSGEDILGGISTRRLFSVAVRLNG